MEIAATDVDVAQGGKVDRILLRFDHMTRRDLLLELVKKCIWVFRNNLNVISATKEV